MLVYIAWIVWFAVWGIIGYATIGSVVTRIKMKRETDRMVAYWAEKRKLEQLAQTGIYKIISHDEK